MSRYVLSLFDNEQLLKDLSQLNHQPGKIVKNSFIVLSDFHAYSYPLEKIVNNYINEYDVIFILGDACDRGADGLGTGGIKILEEIKKYQNNILTGLFMCLEIMMNFWLVMLWE